MDFELSAVLVRRCGAVDEVIRRPRARELHTAIFEFERSRRVFVLVALHGLVVDKVGDIEQHLASIHALAGDLFSEREEHTMHLDRESTRLRLPFALAAGALAKAGQILLADGHVAS